MPEGENENSAEEGNGNSTGRLSQELITKGLDSDDEQKEGIDFARGEGVLVSSDDESEDDDELSTLAEVNV